MQTTWNLSHLYKKDTDPQIEKDRARIEKKAAEFVKKWKDTDSYLSSPAALKKALDDYQDWAFYYAGGGAEGYYFDLLSSLHEDNPSVKAKTNKAEEFSKKIAAQMQFFPLRIARISPKLQKKFLTDPTLKPYKHFLETSFAEAKYLLSEPEEKIMLMKSAPAYGNWTRMVSGFLSKEEREVNVGKGKKQKLTLSLLLSLMESNDKAVRDSAAEAFNDILSKHVEAAENEMNSILQNKQIDDQLRGISRPDLSRHLSDDVETEVVDTMLEAVEKRFDLAQRFYKLKAKLLGLKKLAYHERNIPIGNVDKTYSYENSSALVSRVFKNLDPKFAEIFQTFENNGLLDVYPAKGKRGGAFCAHYLKSLPTYILLNHTNKLRDVLTLAHELGHGINNELMREKQNALNFGTPTSTAEVASTFMEDFVLQELLQEADDKLRLSLLMFKLNDDISTIFRQVAAYRFEQELHGEFRKKGYLSKEEIGKLFQKNMAAYMGPAVEQSPGSENWWVYWNHFRYFFYVYSYASGLLISKSLQNKVKADHAFIDEVKEFLSAGSSESPKNIFKKMGIDISDKKFWNQGLDEIEKLLKETENLANKIQ